MRMDERELLEEARRKAAAITGVEVAKTVHKMKELTAAEEKFCREYTTHFDRKRAILAAGFQGKDPLAAAHRWLGKHRIKTRIKQMQTHVETRTEMNKDIYMKMVADVYERAMADGDYAGANRAVELMGKALGYFVEQKAVLNVSAKMPEDKAQQVAEVQRLARIAGVDLGQ